MATTNDGQDMSDKEDVKSAGEATASKTQGAEWRHGFPDGGLRSWLVLLGAVLVMGCSFGYLSAFSVYETYYLQNQLSHKSPSDIAWIGSLQVFFQFGSGLFSGALFDKYGARVVMVPSTVVYVFAIMMTSLCKEYYQFILAQGLLGGIGVGFLFTPAVSAVNHYFHKKRGMALGIAATGSSIGGVLFPIALKNALYSKLGFGWSVRIIAFVVLGLLIIACILIEERLPHRVGTLFLPKAFVQPSYSFLTAGVFFSIWGMFVPFFFLSTFAYERSHFSTSLAFYLPSVMNGASLFGRLIPGILADKLGRMNMFIVIAISTGVISLCWPQATSHPGLIVWTVFFGFFSGAVISLFPASFAQVTPHPQIIGTYMGQALAIVSIAGLTGSPIAGAILDASGWEATSIFGGVSLVVGGALVAAGRFFSNPKLVAVV